MAFLTPLMLAGLAALIVPILVHLVQRQEPQSTPFPSLMFLSRIPYREKRRRQIRHWLLLLLRCLALALIVFAFARPFLTDTQSAAPALEDRRDLVIALDRSYSMGYADRWQAAQRAATQALAQLGSSDRAAVVLFDRTTQISGALSADFDALQAIVDQQRPSAAGTDFAVALDQAARLLADSPAPVREVLLISDFQAIGRDPETRAQLPPGVRLTPLPVDSNGAPPNAAIAGLTLTRHEQLLEASARILNLATQPLTVAVALEVNGRPVDSQTLSLEAGAVGNAVFKLPATRNKLLRATLSLAEDGLAEDNAFHFVLRPEPSRSVLIVQSGGADTSQNLYLQRALALSTQPRFRIDSKRLDEFRESDIENHDVVIFNDSAVPANLRSFVENGGALLVVTGQRLQGAWPDFLPGVLGARSDSPDGVAIRSLDVDHPLFAPFAAPRSGDLSTARIARYRQLDSKDGDRVLARYDDGGVALIERPLAAGRVLVLTTTLDTQWNDLALQPAFLPFVHQLLKYLAAYRPAPAWYTVGDAVDIGSARNRDTIVETPSGDERRLAPGRPLLLDEHGFYELHDADGASTGAVAVNVDAAESELTPLDAAAFAAEVVSRTGADDAALSPSAPNGQAQRQYLWWYLLLGALGLLALETFLSNRLSRSIA